MGNEFENDFLKDNRIHMDWSVIRWSLMTALEVGRWTFVLWSFVTLLSAFIPALFLTMLQTIVDDVEMNVEAGLGVRSILTLLIALVLVMLVQSAFNRIPSLMWRDLKTKYSIGMVHKLSDFMRKVPVHYFDDARTAKLMSAAQKTTDELGRFVNSFLSSIGAVVTFASMGVVAYCTSPWILVVVVVYLVVMLPLTLRRAKAQYKAWWDTSENDRRAEYYYSRAFKEDTAREARLLNMSDYLVDKWRMDAEIVQEEKTKQQLLSDQFWSFFELAMKLGKFVMLFVGLYLLQARNLTLGGLTVFISVFEQLGAKVSNFGYDFMSVYEESCRLKFKMLLFSWDMKKKRPTEEVTAVPSSRKPEEPQVLFECSHVNFSYKEGKQVLHDFSIRIHKGETVALVGENGAGKSTLIKLLLGLYEPTDGEMYFEGENYREIDMSKLVERIGVTFQDFVRFELMVRENVSFGDISNVCDDSVICEAIANGGATHIVERMPKGIDTYLGRWYEKEGVRMSGGEWQRIAVSRSYINNKDILIMDEPAAALDPIAEMEQFTRIKKSLKKRTAILISHRIGFARLADHIFVLQEGRLAESGSHDELMDQKGIYYEMFTNQAGWYAKGGE